MSWCMRILMLISICVLSVPTRAFDNGQYTDVPDNIRSWFKSVRSPKGVPCCDIADGHRTTWKADETGRYWVPINGEWVQVPPGAVVYNAGNPVGEAVFLPFMLTASGQTVLERLADMPNLLPAPEAPKVVSITGTVP